MIKLHAWSIEQCCHTPQPLPTFTRFAKYNPEKVTVDKGKTQWANSKLEMENDQRHPKNFLPFERPNFNYFPILHFGPSIDWLGLQHLDVPFQFTPTTTPTPPTPAPHHKIVTSPVQNCSQAVARTNEQPQPHKSIIIIVIININIRQQLQNLQFFYPALTNWDEPVVWAPRLLQQTACYVNELLIPHIGQGPSVFTQMNCRHICSILGSKLTALVELFEQLLSL